MQWERPVTAGTGASDSGGNSNSAQSSEPGGEPEDTDPEGLDSGLGVAALDEGVSQLLASEGVSEIGLRVLLLLWFIYACSLKAMARLFTKKGMANEKEKGKTTSAPAPPTSSQDLPLAPLSASSTPTHPLPLSCLPVAAATLVLSPPSSE